MDAFNCMLNCEMKHCLVLLYTDRARATLSFDVHVVSYTVLMFKYPLIYLMLALICEGVVLTMQGCLKKKKSCNGQSFSLISKGENLVSWGCSSLLAGGSPICPTVNEPGTH